MKLGKSAAVVTISASVVAGAFAARAALAWQTGNVIIGIVKQVYDGDGLWLDDGDGDPKTFLEVRLFGINAPEWNHLGGQEAKKFLGGRIKGQRVRCTVQGIDRYNRPLGVCLDDSGRDLSCAVAWAGHAVVTNARYARCDRTKLPPPSPAPF